MTDEDFAKLYEPWLHGLAVVATFGVALGKISPRCVYRFKFFHVPVTNHYSTLLFHRH
jgi:hypothetical protein